MFLRSYTYVQYVRPHSKFATPAWAPWTKADIKVLEQVHIKAVGMVSDLGGTTFEEKYEELGVDTHERRRDRKDLVLTQKVLHDNEAWVKNMFQKAPERQGITTRGTAEKNTLVVQSARLDLRKNYLASELLRAGTNWGL